MFGEAPSDAAQKAAELLRKEGITEILEFGPGQGRDTMFFAQNGFRVRVLDYCQEAGVFIVHFFNKEKVGHLARGFQILGIDEFEQIKRAIS